MDRHISEMIVEYNLSQEALKDAYISNHISRCDECNELFKRYFNSLEILRNGSGIPSLDSSDSDEILAKIIENKPELHSSRSKRLLKITAIAAAVLIIILSTIYFIADNIRYRTAELNNLTGILNSTNQEEIEMISDMDIYSNLEIIEHLEELESLHEVLDDAS